MRANVETSDEPFLKTEPMSTVGQIPIRDLPNQPHSPFLSTLHRDAEKSHLLCDSGYVNFCSCICIHLSGGMQAFFQ